MSVASRSQFAEACATTAPLVMSANTLSRAYSSCSAPAAASATYLANASLNAFLSSVSATTISLKSLASMFSSVTRRW